MMDFYKEVFKKTEKVDEEFYKNFFTEQLILRDYLAIERTILTNESTFLAYLRTSLTILVVGVTIFQLSPNNELFQYLGISFSLFGVYIFFRGSVRSSRMKNKIDKFLKKREQVDVVLEK